jgi:hypothetical protein
VNSHKLNSPSNHLLEAYDPLKPYHNYKASAWHQRIKTAQT